MRNLCSFQVRDIDQDRLHVRHAWSDADGLKTPKNGEERVCPLVPAVRDELLTLARSNPHGLTDHGFVFCSTLRDKPCDHSVLLDGLNETLIRLSVGKSKSNPKREKAREEWDERNIVFHGWRHFALSVMAGMTDARKLMMVSDHKTAQVFDRYANHTLESDLVARGVVAAEAFGNIVPFDKAVPE